MPISNDECRISKSEMSVAEEREGGVGLRRGTRMGEAGQKAGGSGQKAEGSEGRVEREP
jgi:hypothetical protein